MRLNDNQRAFFELLRAGLWEKEARLSLYKNIDFSAIQKLAEEQTVVGLITAGLEKVSDIKIPKDVILQFVGSTLQIEQRSEAMNGFIASLINRLRNEDVYALLVKGQGIAQCYERPLWRSSGDVDLYLSKTNYEKSSDILKPLAKTVDEEDKQRLHLSMTIIPWVVELHGTMYSDFSRRMNRGLDDIHKNLFYGGEVRSWFNNGTQVFLPSPNNDIIIVFTHFLQHFYFGGIGLRQVCDWCRLLYKYNNSIDNVLLKSRLKKMGLYGEWTAFASFAVEQLGMPQDLMPYYFKTSVDTRRANRILGLILETGNLGHNADESYRTRYPYFVHKCVTFIRRVRGYFKHVTIFPINSTMFYMSYMFHHVKVTIIR